MSQKQTLIQRLYNNWEAKLISAAQVVMGAAMVPTLLSPEAVVPLTSSIPVTLGLSALVVSFWKPEMAFARYTSLVSVVLWEGIAVMRHG